MDFLKSNKDSSHRTSARLLKIVIVVAIILLVVCSSLLELQVILLMGSDDQTSIGRGGTPTGQTFRVAAYEQKLVNVDNVTTRRQALVGIRGNLANIKKQAAIASEMGVNVLVLAEYGITGDMGTQDHKRSSVYPYMEEIPDVSVTKPACVSCDKIDPKVEGQTTIGCIALKYNMYVLANLIESVPCDNTLDNQCPSDGHYQYNTNIVYNPKGCLIAKYHKYHRFMEELYRLDRPFQPEYVYFDTEYGRFGTMICMDSLYENPGLKLAETYGIDHMLFPTYWQSSSVYQRAISWQLAFATIANVNFVAANIHSIEDNVYGSSILSGSKMVNYTANYKSSQGTLIIGDLPTNKPSMSEHRADNSTQAADDIINQLTGSVVIDEVMFNVAVLENLTGKTQVCQNTFCCLADYSRNTTDDTYIVGVFKGVHTYEAPMAMEACLVYKCRDKNISSCGKSEITSATRFSYLKLSATFSVHYVYPVILPADLRYDQLRWSIQHSKFHNSLLSSSDWPMVAVALIGRDFKNDPTV